jgi:hypothetical protein
MRKLGLVVFVAVSCYLAAWTLFYIFVMGSDFDYYVEYFRLAWSGGGEKPAMIQLLALAVTAVVAAITTFIVVRSRHAT